MGLGAGLGAALGHDLAVAAAGRGDVTGSERPNVLLVVVDDLCNRVGCYGDRLAQSPHIDALAGHGVRFERAYCQFPVCNPSRTSFLTGLRPDRTGVLDNRTPFRTKLPDATTLPQHFKRHGYRTARFGKIFHGAGPMDDPKAWDFAADPQGTPIGRTGTGRNMTGGQVAWCRWLAAEGTDDDQPDGRIAAGAVDWLDRHGHEPFFLAVGFHRPHDPFVAPKRYYEPYPLEKCTPPDPGVDPSNWHPFILGSGWKKAFDAFTDRDRREFIRAYYAGVTFVDVQIGRVLAALDRLDLTRRTVVVLLGDHGYQLGEHAWWNKNTLFEPSARAPVIVAGPGIPGGRASRRVVEFLDIYPTIVELCGLPRPAHVQGRSLRPLLRDVQADWEDRALTQVHRGPLDGYSIRTDRWRYSEWTQRSSGQVVARELYDHTNDPAENRNLASVPGHAQTVRRLAARLARLRGSAG